MHYSEDFQKRLIDELTKYNLQDDADIKLRLKLDDPGVGMEIMFIIKLTLAPKGIKSPVLEELFEEWRKMYYNPNDDWCSEAFPYQEYQRQQLEQEEQKGKNK